MRLLIVLILIGTVFNVSVAAAGPQNGGLAVSYVSPKDDLAERVDSGLGLALIFDYPFAGLVNLTGTAGRYRFSGKSDNESFSLWEFAAGPQADFGVLYLGCEAGYYSKLSEWGLTPNAGIRKGKYDIGLRYTTTGDENFVALRAGMFF